MTKIQFPLLLLAALSVCSLFAVPAQAQRDRVFVASYGSDSNSCTFGSPCKTFQNAINVVAQGGEVTAIDSAGFGPINISHSVTITSPAGVEAGIVSAGSSAISINAGASDTVVLSGLTLDGNQTTTNGIYFTSGGSLEVVNCAIRGFKRQGINVQAATATSVQITNTIVTDMPGSSSGIFLSSGGASTASIIAALDGVTIVNTDAGIETETLGAPIELLISNSHIDNNSSVGVDVAGSSSSAATTAILRNVTLNQEPHGLIVEQYAAAYISKVTQSAVAGFTTNDGLRISGANAAAYSDGTSHFMATIINDGIFSSWTPQ
jgi:hypothetical protein